MSLPQVLPLEDETFSSFLKRVASARLMSLDEFCDVIGLDHNQRRADLDAPPAKGASMAARIAGLRDSDLAALTLPRTLLRSTWDPSCRRHGAGVMACPFCLQGSHGHARRWWRSPFAEACPVHGTWLVSNCPSCGETLRHRSEILDVHWLDSWPFCASCGAEIPVASAAPLPVLTATRHWEAAFSGRIMDGYDPETVHVLSRRVRAFFASHPAAAQNCLATVNDLHSVTFLATVLTLNAVFERRHLRCDPASEELCKLLLGMAPSSSLLASALEDQAAQLSASSGSSALPVPRSVQSPFAWA